MSQQTALKRETIQRTLHTLLLGVFSLATILYGGFSVATQKALAATNNTVNFQARLEGAGGSIAPDGFYNVQFKLYSASTGGAALWTESYLDVDGNGGTTGDDYRVKVVNGYLSVALGSRTAFPAINWDQELYVTMNIGGTTITATPTYDGEMSPRLKLTGVPYAFRAGQLATSNSGGTLTSTLSVLQPTVGAQTFQIQDQAAAGTYNVCIQGAAAAAGGCAASTGAAGYIQNQNASAQGTSNFWLSGTGRADVALQAPSFDAPTAVALNIGTTNATSIVLGKTGVNTRVAGGLSVGTTMAGGAITIANGAWVTGVDAAGTGTVNMFSVNGQNQIQVGAALSVDGGIILPTNGGQLTLSDLPIDSSVSAGTKQSYTLRVGSSNALTVYGEADGSGNAQNIRVAIGGSINPGYTLDVGGDLNLSSGSVFRINGTQICSSTGCTAASGSANYIQNQNSGAQSSSNFWMSGTGRADTALQAPLFDTPTATTLNIGTTNATSINLNKNTTVSGNLTLGASAGSGTLLTNNGSTVNSTLALGNFSSGGAIGTAAATVDIYSSISIAQTSGSQTLTIPAPTASTTYGRAVYLSNIGTSSFTLLGTLLKPGATAALIWSNTSGGASWHYAGADGSGILNQSSTSQTADFSINGTGVANAFSSNTFSSSGNVTLQAATGNTVNINPGANGGGSGTLNLAVNAATLNIGNGSNNARVIDIATTNGSQTQTVTIGNNASGSASSLTTVQGSNGVLLQTNRSTSGVITRSITNSTTAFAIQNTSSVSLLTADTTNSVIRLGTASSLGVGLAFANGTNANTVTIQGGTTSTSYTTVLPSAIGTTNQCLIVASVVTTTQTLGYTTCPTATSSIQNQNASVQTTSVFWISGTGRSDTGFLANAIDSHTSGGLINVGFTNAAAVTVGGGLTNVVNLGTGAVNKSITIGATGTTNNTTAINIGNTTSAGGASTIQIGGTGATNGSDSATTVIVQAGQTALTVAHSGATIKMFTDSSSAFRIQNASGRNLLAVDSTSNMSVTTEGGALNVFGVGNPGVPSLSLGSGGSLAYSTEYMYRLAVIAESGIYTAATAASPTSVSTAASGTVRTATLTWATVPNNNGYVVYRSVDGGTNWFSNIRPANTTSLVDNGSTYTWTNPDFPGTANGTGGINMQEGTSLIFDAGTGAYSSSVKFIGSDKALIMENTNAGGSMALRSEYFVFQDTISTQDVLSIASNGSAIFKTNSNSAQAFQVQNSSNTSIFTIDTADSIITIGPSGGDTIGTILVLGTKTDAGDPAGVDGAMYYNADAEAFRCYSGGAWQYCGGTPSAAYGYHLEEDFFSDDISSGSIGSNGLLSSGNGTGWLIRKSAPTLSTRPGILELVTGTTTTGRASVYSGDITGDPMVLGGGETIEMGVAIPTLATAGEDYIARFGFCDVVTAGDCTDGVYFEYDRATSANWRMISVSNSASTKASTSTAVTTSWVNLKIVLNSAGTSATYYINGASVGTVSSNIPTGSARGSNPMAKVNKTAGTTSRFVQVDYIDVQNSFSGMR